MSQDFVKPQPFQNPRFRNSLIVTKLAVILIPILLLVAGLYLLVSFSKNPKQFVSNNVNNIPTPSAAVATSTPMSKEKMVYTEELAHYPQTVVMNECASSLESAETLLFNVGIIKTEILPKEDVVWTSNGQTWRALVPLEYVEITKWDPLWPSLESTALSWEVLDCRFIHKASVVNWNEEGTYKVGEISYPYSFLRLDSVVSYIMERGIVGPSYGGLTPIQDVIGTEYYEDSKVKRITRTLQVHSLCDTSECTERQAIKDLVFEFNKSTNELFVISPGLEF